MAKQIGPIEIMMRAIGGDAVAAMFRRAASDASNMGRDLQNVGNGGAAALADVERGARGVDAALSQVGQNQGFNTAAQGAENLASSTDTAASRTEELTGKLEKIRNAGAGIAAAGVGGLILSRQLSQVAAEGDAVEARLESILKQQGRFSELDAQNEIVNDVTVRGHFADDDEIRNATVLLDSFSVSTAHMSELLEDAARQARTMGTDVSSVAQQLGTAYNSGQVGMLKKSGITISEAELQRIKDAYAISQKFGQQTFVDVLGPAIRANTAALEDSLTETQQAANDAARELDNLQTSLGQGVQVGEKNLNQVVVKLLQVANASPEAAQGIGQIGFYVSSLATVIGGGAGLVAQIGLARLAFPGLATAGTTAMAAIRLAALGATGSVLLLAGAAALAVGAITLALYSWNKNKDKITNPTQSNEDKRTGEQVAQDEQSKSSVQDAIAKSQGMSDRDRYAVLRAGTRKLSELGEPDAVLELDPELRALRKKMARDYKDAASEEGKALVASILGQSSGNLSARHADNGFQGYKNSNDDLSDIQAQKADLNKQIAAMKGAASGGGAVGGGVPSGSVPASGAAPSLLASGAALPSGSPSGASGSSGGDIDALQAEADSLHEQLRHAKGKSNAALRASLQDRLASLGIQMREARKAASAERKSASASEREAKTAEKTAEKKSDQAAHYAAQVGEARSDAEFQIKIAQLEAEKDGADKAREKALDFQIAQLRAQKDYAGAMAAANGLDDDNPAAKSAAREVAKIHRDAALRLAQIERDKPDKDKDKQKTSFNALLAKLRAGGSLKVGGPLALSGSDIGGNSGAVFNPNGVNRSSEAGAFATMIAPGAAPASRFYDGNGHLAQIGGGFRGSVPERFTYPMDTSGTSGGAHKVGKPKMSKTNGGNAVRIEFPPLEIETGKADIDAIMSDLQML